MQLDEQLGQERAGRLRGLIRGALVDAYTENCNRYSEELGDDNLVFAVSVVHNLRHMLAEALEFEEGISITRPRGSFQVEIDGRFVLHFYKVPAATGDVGEMRFDRSRTKLELVSENTAQLSLEFEDAQLVSSPARQLVVLHSGTPDEGLGQVLVGAPYLSDVNGLRWAWLEELTDGGIVALPGVADDLRRFEDESELPELVVRLRGSAERSSTDGSVSA